MGLLSFFQRRSNAADAASKPVGLHDDVAAARTRARRRLIGAAVLLMMGVIGFPLVFETQPRPVPVDIPIEIPRKDGSPVLEMPPARAPLAKASGLIVASPRDETAALEAPREVPAAASAATARQPVPATETKKPDAEPPRPAATAASEAARARALLEAKAEPKAPVAKEPAVPTSREGGRFVVQAGAFADAAAAREMRARLEKLGLKSYTQVVETSSGSRTRVRAGPYATREDAEKALAKAKSAGVGAVVLTL